MSEATVRAQIYTILSGAAGVGKVYNRERWAVDWGSFINLFKDSGSGRILGWEIGRKAPITEDESSVRKHTFFIRGYMGVNDADATELLFNALLENIAAAFRADKDLGGAALGHDFIQVETLDTRSFGSVLCHFAELTLTVHEHITGE